MNELQNFDIPIVRRITPTFAPSQNTATNKPLQDVAAPVQVHADAAKEPKDYTLSVEDVRMQLHEIGISKSKDTIQRYCREGDLDCQKLGMFKRYFATEGSVETLIEKLQSDAPALNRMPVHEGARSSKQDEVQVHAPAPDKDTVKDRDLHEASSDGVQVHEPASSGDVHNKKIVEMLEKQIDDKDKMIFFLEDELVARRGAVSALEKIIDAFGDNSKASLLTAENEKREIDFHHSNQGRGPDAQVVRDAHSVENTESHPGG